MWRIPNSALKQWEQSTPYKYPKSISLACPFCGVTALFYTGLGREFHSHAQSSTVRCPSCDHFVSFFFINREVESSIMPVEVYCYPPPTKRFTPSDYGSDVPDRIRSAILSSVDSFNAGIYPSATVSGRRALEGMFKHLARDEDKGLPLHAMIESVRTSMVLGEPLAKLAHLIRKSGNIGAHFDEEKEPDEEMARNLVELLDYLAVFMFVLPKRIGGLEEHL